MGAETAVVSHQRTAEGLFGMALASLKIKVSGLAPLEKWYL